MAPPVGRWAFGIAVGFIGWVVLELLVVVVAFVSAYAGREAGEDIGDIVAFCVLRALIAAPSTLLWAIVIGAAASAFRAYRQSRATVQD